jgi:hypothetical protein
LSLFQGLSIASLCLSWLALKLGQSPVIETQKIVQLEGTYTSIYLLPYVTGRESFLTIPKVT